MKPQHLPILLSVLLTGCAGNGYISSSIHTVVGLDVSENPKTQVPHVRFGYVRSGLYYVPTGKSPGPPNSQNSNISVKDTPELVSEIFVNSKFLSSMTINEKFAIGAGAVGTQAAKANFQNTAGQMVAAGATPAEIAALEPIDLGHPEMTDSQRQALLAEARRVAKAEAAEHAARMKVAQDDRTDAKIIADFGTKRSAVLRTANLTTAKKIEVFDNVLKKARDLTDAEKAANEELDDAVEDRRVEILNARATAANTEFQNSSAEQKRQMLKALEDSVQGTQL